MNEYNNIAAYKTRVLQKYPDAMARKSWIEGQWIISLEPYPSTLRATGPTSYDAWLAAWRIAEDRK